MICSRTACQRELGTVYYKIWNQPSTGIPREYCVSCGRRIVELNQHDHTKLKSERVVENVLPALPRR
jgi:hypothetical protein